MQHRLMKEVDGKRAPSAPLELLFLHFDINPDDLAWQQTR